VVLAVSRFKQGKALAYAQILAASKAFCNWPSTSVRSGTACVKGPTSTWAAATRSALSALMVRANTASAMVGALTPMSSATWLVHLPVPFCSAVSKITSTKA